MLPTIMCECEELKRIHSNRLVTLVSTADSDRLADRKTNAGNLGGAGTEHSGRQLCRAHHEEPPKDCKES
jgi:hypothetical protein